MVDTSDEWIKTRTGVLERRILKDNSKGSSFLAIKAVQDLVEKTDLDTSEVDLVILTTATPDMPVAITSVYVATKIGAKNAYAFDLTAACSGFIYSLSVAAAYVESGKYRKVLVIGTDKMSSIVDYKDRTTCILFGDGAGAVLLEPNTRGVGILDEILKTDGEGRDSLKIEAGGSILPASQETVLNRQHFIKQDGQTVFKHAVSNMGAVISGLMERNNLTKDNLNWLVPHQANRRIIDALGTRIGLDSEKVMLNIYKYGNTTTATIPLLLNEYQKKIKKGENLILCAFGAGFTWGAIYLKWAYNS
ncbi:3-oxoacyl-[acyl-carrier-protein] synthase 3 [Elysia marginata]|uniref:3-oxoacyl-[acyl-carrier-protein] synthase 3 n=1 Tax=Elysia marginata TaxID=1093978 RepID=A0AAV4GWD4_9GAST|nr:3-oxoacyl-[acyl-carrier-protein] synthase 3 [Elysia marginata]